MFPPFPCSSAEKFCVSFINLLNSQKIILKQVTQISSERKNQGVMIGCLVCENKKNETIILVANSGISKKLKLKHAGHKFMLEGVKWILVPSIVNAKQIERALKKNDKQIHILTEKINLCKDDKEKNQLEKKRSVLTTESLIKVHSLYKFMTIDGENFSIEDLKVNPPTGTGDCCEIKLLHYAFSHHLQPLSMNQFFCEKSILSPFNFFASKKSVPPCDERCALLIPKMLGLEILYVDESIVVVNKPSGLLSVPGRGIEKQDCVVNRIKKIYPSLCKISQPSVHRLDMETSGLMVLAFTEEAHKNLSRQFENRVVKKEYEALLSGVLEKDGKGLLVPKHGEKSGTINLRFRLDVENRPHQIYDEVYGKEGITDWENLGIVWYTAPDGTQVKSTKILFRPKTGRTHQLRLASADSHGFGLPIIGDALYGSCKKGERLMLHAKKIIFNHPADGRKMEFEKESNF